MQEFLTFLLISHRIFFFNFNGEHRTSSITVDELCALQTTNVKRTTYVSYLLTPLDISGGLVKYSLIFAVYSSN